MSKRTSSNHSSVSSWLIKRSKVSDGMLFEDSSVPTSVCNMNIPASLTISTDTLDQ